MVNRRGLSPDEFNNLDPDVLEALMVYDAYIEPSGTKIDMLFHAHRCYSEAISNPNLTESFRKGLKITDFDFLQIIDGENLTTKERQERHLEKIKEKQANDITSLGEQIKKIALGKNNGK